MADTRCVNPEYQLDVDVMILEYLLYQSIRAHFKASVLPSDRPVNQDGISALRDEANRLLLAFDCKGASLRHIGPQAADSPSIHSDFQAYPQGLHIHREHFVQHQTITGCCYDELCEGAPSRGCQRRPPCLALKLIHARIA